MPVWELATMTWEDARALSERTPVALLPVGAVEAHGPHLPVTTDVIIAEAMARSGAELLAERGIPALILPPLSYAPAPFAAEFPGTITVRPETLRSLVADIARSAASHGARALAIANAHLDPAHIGALHEAGAEAGRHLAWAFPDVTRRPWAARLTDEFRSGACHAGQYETSIVMAARPKLVREDARRDLPPVMSSLTTAMREGRDTFEAAGGPRAYFGDPVAATAAEGHQTIAELGRILEEAVLDAIGIGKDRWEQ